MNLGSQPQDHGGTDAPVGLDGAAAAYRLGPRLGRAGEVYAAEHPRLEERAVVKLYRRATGLGATVTEAFCREAVRASGLRHPHIAHVIEAGTFADGTPFMAVEFLNGQTLEERMVGRGAFLATELLPLVRGTASALSAAHAAGVFHRELRPDNIFIADVAGYEQGFVKLLDFGVCHLTAAQIVSGRGLGLRTTRYFAPEQLEGNLAEADGRSDQFALAAIAYRMLNGIDPPAAQSGSRAGRETEGRSAPVSTLARRAPAVDAVVSKALSRRAEDRFESVALFLRAFEEALTGAALISTPGPVRQPSEPIHAATIRVVPDMRPRRPSPLADFSANHEVDRASLSDRFFAEGDHQEATRFKNLPHVDAGSVSDAHLEFDSFDRIPTRRTPLVIALLVLIVGSGGAAWWAGVRPPETWQRSALWQRLHLPPMPRPVVVPKQGAATPPSEPAVPPRVAAAAAPVAVPVPTVGVAPPIAAAPAAPGAALAPPAAPATPVAAAPSPGAPSEAGKTPETSSAGASPPGVAGDPAQPAVAPVAPAAPSETQPARPLSAGGSEAPPVVVVPIPSKFPPEKKRARPPSKGEATHHHSGPLMLWSAEKQAMVPADGTSGSDSWRPATPSGHSEPWPRANTSPSTPSPPPPPPLFPSSNGPAPPPFRP